MKFDLDKILDIVDEFLQVPSVTNNEKFFLKFLNERALKLGFNCVLRDNFLAVRREDSTSKHLFSIHVDRHGVVRTPQGEFEYSGFFYKKEEKVPFIREEKEEFEFKLVDILKDKLNFDKILLDEQFLLFKNSDFPVLKFTRAGGPEFYERVALRYVGETLIGVDESGNKLGEYKIRRYDCDFRENKVCFDLDSEPSLEEVFFMLKSSIFRKGNLFSAQVDNVICSAILFYLMENFDFKDEVIFTCGEEIGISWKSVVSYVEEFEKRDLKLVVLDTSPYPTFKDKDEGFLTLRYGDENSGFNEELVEEIKSFVESQGISYDFKPSFMGRTELGRVCAETESKISGTTLQLPTLNYHTSYESSTMESLENFVKVIFDLGFKKK